MGHRKEAPQRFWTVLGGRAFPIDPPPKKPRGSPSSSGEPHTILQDCVSLGNGGDGFVFENVNALGVNLIAQDNAGDGIRSEGSNLELINPEVK